MFTEPLPANIELAGANIEYGRQGTGRSLLYLHGCDGVDVSDPFIEPLSQRFEVVFPSLPGFGASDLPTSLGNIGDLVYFTMELAERLQLSDCVLVGSSFGGWVAAELATMQSGRFSHLILADSLGARFSSTPDEVEIRDIFTVPGPELPQLLFSDPDKAKASFGALDFVALPETAALRYCRNKEALTLFGWAPLLNNPGLLSRLHRINLPTLVLWGEEDQIASTAYGRRFAGAIPGAVFESIAAAGHYLPMEQPNLFAEKVISFAGGKV